MKLGIFAKTFEGTDALAVMAAARDAGFATVQYNMACSGLSSMPDDISAAVAKSVRDAGLDSGIAIAAVSATYNMVHPEVGLRKLGLKRLEVLAARGAEMGTELLTLCTGTRHATDQWQWHAENNSTAAWSDLCTEMSMALDIAERYNVILGIEPELANVVNSAAKAKLLLDEMKSPRLKIVFDAANLFETVSLQEQHAVVSTSVDMLADHIVMAHAKDRKRDGSFTVAGQGCLDYGHYIACLKAIGFDGALITHGLAATDAAAVGQFLHSHLERAKSRGA